MKILLSKWVSGILSLANGGTGLSALAKQGTFIDAGAFDKTTTAGCTVPAAAAETTTNKINYQYLEFPDGSDTKAFVNLRTPPNWDGTLSNLRVHWTSAAGTASNGVRWSLKALALSDDDAIDTATGSAGAVTDALLAQGDKHVSPAIASLTPSNSPAAGDEIYLEVERVASHADDNLAGAVRFRGISFNFGISTYEQNEP